MDLLRRWSLIALVALLFGCLGGCDRDSSSQDASAPPPLTQVPLTQDSPAGDTPDSGHATAQDCRDISWPDGNSQSGRETYERACASCHDEGLDGAPATGDRDAWTSRSFLWSAVLLVHAREGYLDMPAKGGQPEESDRDVEAAGEYMLCKTFPELPRG